MKNTIPALVIALGIIGGTAVTSVTSDWMMLSGALILAGSMVVAGLLQARLQSENRAPMAATFIMGGVVILATCILIYSNPANVPKMLPILGCCGVMLLIVPNRRTRNERD